MNTLNANKCLILIIDIQDKLIKIAKDDTVKKNAIAIAKTAEILNLPVIVTEQYPKGLGSTIDEIKSLNLKSDYYEKTTFSVLKEKNINDKILHYYKNQIVLFGIETHICVLQSAIDLLNAGYEVFIVQDCCCSRNDENKNAAIRRLIHAGCSIATTEMVLFELLESSKHPNFKEIQALIK